MIKPPEGYEIVVAQDAIIGEDWIYSLVLSGDDIHGWTDIYRPECGKCLGDCLGDGVYIYARPIAEPAKPETTYESEGIKCPACGYLDGDSWEHHIGESEWYDNDIECPNCEAKLCVSKSVSITYKASLKEVQNG